MRDVWRRSLSSGTIVKSMDEFCWKKKIQNLRCSFTLVGKNKTESHNLQHKHKLKTESQNPQN